MDRDSGSNVIKFPLERKLKWAAWASGTGPMVPPLELPPEFSAKDDPLERAAAIFKEVLERSRRATGSNTSPGAAL